MTMHILAGQFKGRRLHSPPGQTTRPMTGRAKKSLMQILAPLIVDRPIADLYCGTGTVGLEALSRGAATCVFAERDRRALAGLRRNIEELDLACRTVVCPGDLTASHARWQRAETAPLAAAFVDPPYPAARRWDWERITTQLFEPLADRLADDGLAVLRLPAGVPLPDEIGRLILQRRKQYGDMTVGLFGRQPGAVGLD